MYVMTKTEQISFYKGGLLEMKKMTKEIATEAIFNHK